MDERVCEGFKIIDSQRVGSVEIVLGHSLTAGQPYVTWKTYEHSDYQSYEHGHYFDTHQEARIDFYDRIKEAWECYSPARKRTQEHGRTVPDKGR